MPSFAQEPDCGYEMAITVTGMPDGVSYAEGVLSVDVKEESLAGGYTVEYTATCSEGP